MSGRLTTSQKGIVQQFMNFASASEEQAIKWLRSTGWSLDAATNAFFDSGENPEGASSASADADFRRYSDAEGKQIDTAGLERLCKDMGMDLYSSPQALLMCQKADAAAAGVLTLPEWRRLMGTTGAKSVAELPARLPVAETSKEPFWTWAYKFNCEPGQKSAAKDVVVAMLDILAPTWPLLNQFKSFVEAGRTSLTKDTWSQLLKFMAKFNSVADLRALWSEEDDATWPSQLDEFREAALRG